MASSKFHLRNLTSQDEVMVSEFIQNQVVTITKDYFFPPNTNIIYQCLCKQTGISCGAFDDEMLIGVRLAYLPGLSKENHGYDLGFTNDQLNRVVQFHGAVVINNRRYTGIGKQLVEMNCNDILKKEDSIILATVHPNNQASIKMLVRNGFVEQKRLLKYNNLPRIIFSKTKL